MNKIIVIGFRDASRYILICYIIYVTCMFYLEFLMNENCILNVGKSALQFVSCSITFIKHNKHKMSIVCTCFYWFIYSYALHKIGTYCLTT